MAVALSHSANTGFASENSADQLNNALSNISESLFHHSTPLSEDPRKKGEELIRLGNYDAAASLYESLLKDNPDQVDLILGLGSAYEHTNKRKQAITLYKHAQELQPDRPDLNLALGYAYLAIDDYGTSKALFQRVLKNDPNNADAITGIGRIAALRGNAKEADDFYQKALKIKPRNPRTMIYISKLYQQKGDFTEAQNVLTKLASQYPDDPEVKQSLKDLTDDKQNLKTKAEALVKEQKWEEAAGLYEKLVNAYPNNPEYMIELGRLYSILGKQANLIATYNKVLKLQPDNKDIKLALAHADLVFNDLGHSKKLYEGVLEQDPKNLDALAGLGRVAALTGDPKTAQHYYEEALKLDPKHETTLVYIGKLKLQQQKYSEAKEYFTKVLQIYPNDEELKQGLADIETNESQIRSQIDTLVKAQKWSEAEVQYEKLLSMFPNNVDDMLELGKIYSTLGRMQQAIDIYTKALEIDPKRKDIKLALAYSNLYYDNLGSSKELFQSLLDSDPKNVDALAGLGRIAYLNGDLLTANDYLQKALKIEPDNKTALVYLGILRTQQKRYYEARQIFTNLSKTYQNDTDIAQGLEEVNKQIKASHVDVDALVKDKKWDDAIARYKELIKEYPDDADDMLALGRIYVTQNRTPEAIEIYNEALDLHPDRLDILQAAAYANLYDNNLGTANQLFQNIIQQDPKSVEALAGLGKVASLRGDLASAEDYYNRALAIDPDNPTALIFMGYLRLDQKRYADAKKIFDTLKARNPDNPDIKDGLEMLARADKEGLLTPPATKPEEKTAAKEPTPAPETKPAPAPAEAPGWGGPYYAGAGYYPGGYGGGYGGGGNPGGGYGGGGYPGGGYGGYGGYGGGVQGYYAPVGTLAGYQFQPVSTALPVGGTGQIIVAQPVVEPTIQPGTAQNGQTIIQPVYIPILASNAQGITQPGSVTVEPGAVTSPVATPVPATITVAAAPATTPTVTIQAPAAETAAPAIPVVVTPPPATASEEAAVTAPPSVEAVVPTATPQPAVTASEESAVPLPQAPAAIATPTSVVATPPAPAPAAVTTAPVPAPVAVQPAPAAPTPAPEPAPVAVQTTPVAPAVAAPSPEAVQPAPAPVQQPTIPAVEPVPVRQGGGKTWTASQSQGEGAETGPINESPAATLATELKAEESTDKYLQELAGKTTETYEHESSLREHADNLVKEGHYNEGAAVYEELVGAHPTNVTYILNLAQIYLAMGRINESLELYKRALTLQPHHPEVRLLTAYAYLTGNQLPAAKELFHTILSQSPANASAIAGLGRSEALANDYYEAEQHYVEALKYDAKNINALLYYADLKIVQKRYAEAVSLLNLVKQIDPNNPYVEQGIREAQDKELNDKIRKLIQKKQFQEAVAEYQRLIDSTSDNTDYIVGLANAYMAMEDFTRGIASYKKALSQQPDREDILTALAFAFIRQKDYEQANSVLKQLLTKNPKNVEALAAMGRLATINEDETAAEKFFETALQIDPKSTTTLEFYALLRIKQKRYEAAQKLYYTLLGIDATNEGYNEGFRNARDLPIVQRAKELEEENDLYSAEALYQLLLANSPTNMDYYLDLARVYNSLNCHNRAIQILCQALYLKPDDNEVINALGFTYLTKANDIDMVNGEFKFIPYTPYMYHNEKYNLEMSGELFQNVLLRDPNNIEAMAGLGRYYTLKDCLPLADNYISAALEMDPENQTALAYMAALRTAQKRYFAALYHYRYIIDRYPDDADAIKNYWSTIKVTDPNFTLLGFYDEENEKDQTTEEWEARLKDTIVQCNWFFFLNPFNKTTGSVVDEYYILDNLITGTKIYALTMQRMKLGIERIKNAYLSYGGGCGVTYYTQYEEADYPTNTGFYLEPFFNVAWSRNHLTATIGTFGDSPIVARSFTSVRSTLVARQVIQSSCVYDFGKRREVGCEASYIFYRSNLIYDQSQLITAWIQVTPPCFWENISLRYQFIYGNYNKLTDTFYTFADQTTHWLKLGISKKWCDDTIILEAGFWHAWQHSFEQGQIIVVNPTIPFHWVNRQINAAFVNLKTKLSECLDFSVNATYSHDNFDYTTATVSGEIDWRY